MTLVVAGVLTAGSVLVTGCSGGVLASCGLTAPAVGAGAQAGGSPAGSTGGQLGGADGSIAAPGAGAAPGFTVPAARPQVGQESTVTLVTGDRVRLDTAPDGQQAVMPMLPKAGGGAAAGQGGFVRLSWAGDQFAVPYSAVPYLGGVLDPRLFDVSYLARAGLDDAHSATLPVTVSYAGQAAGAGLPGVRVISRSGDTATAVVAKADAGRLGQMLAGQWRASRTGPRAAGAAGLAGIARIALAPPAGAPTLPAALPQPAAPGAGHASRVPYHTLTLNFTGPDGAPAAAVGWVQNLDNAQLATYFVAPDLNSLPLTGTPGPVSFSVPAGAYSVQFTVLSPHPGTLFGTDGALVVKPQVTVDSDQTVTLDARTARRYQVALDPAVPVTGESDSLGLIRGSTTGGCGLGLGLFIGLLSSTSPGSGSTASSLSATPTQAVSDGTLGFDASSELSTQDPNGPPSAAPAYTLDFPHLGSVPSNLSFTIAQKSLTTVASHVYASPSGVPSGGCYNGGAAELFTGIYLWGTFNEVVGTGESTDVPTGPVTDYWYTSAPGTDVWQDIFNASDCSRHWDTPQTITAGERITEDWGKAPQVPTPALHQSALFNAFGPAALNPMTDLCAACRQDDNGMLYLMPGGDSDPAHFYEYVNFSGVPDTATLDFYRNGALTFTSAAQPSGQIIPFNLDLPLLPAAAIYRLNWTQTRPGDSAASADTDWTFRSSPADPAAHLPPTEVCAPDMSQGCSFLPLLFITYDLALNDSSQATAGTPFQIAFTVGHQQNEPAPAGVSATVSASFDDGTTWTAPQPAASQGGNRFAVTIDQPSLASTSGFVSLRVTARDGAGNSVTQTIIRAYGLTS